MRTVNYPVRGRTLENTFTQETADKLVHKLEIWMQGPGVAGGLQLHPCWGKTSVLDKRYQGESVFQYNQYTRCTMRLYDATGNVKWLKMTNDFISNLLFLQEPDGGFRHASNEFEPTFNSGSTCPIHQASAVIALLNYAGWPSADTTLKGLIRPAVDRHWEWFQSHFWLIGSGPHRPFPYKAGWCGVTNQDLSVVAALALYGKVYGDMSRYNAYGRPALEVFLSDSYYYKKLGLFERGDGMNFAERTAYYVVVLTHLCNIYRDTGEKSLPEVIDNVTAHIFDAAYTAPDGMTHLSWGAATYEDDKTRIKEWIRTPVTFSCYSGILPFMKQYLKRHPDKEKQGIYDALCETLCAYVFEDGSIPLALWTQNPILSLSFAPERDTMLAFALDCVGDELCDPEPVKDICIHRRSKEYIWKQNGKLWAIEKNGERAYGGYTGYTAGVTIGAEEMAVWGDYASLDECELLETIGE